MSRTIRHSRRQQDKAKRRARRKQSRKDRIGQKAGSIAIHSRLPGIEGTMMGDMEVIVDVRRQEQHPAEIAVTVASHADRRMVQWLIETGFGGHAPRVGYQVLQPAQLDTPPPITWVFELADDG